MPLIVVRFGTIGVLACLAQLCFNSRTRNKAKTPAGKNSLFYIILFLQVRQVFLGSWVTFWRFNRDGCQPGDQSVMDEDILQLFADVRANVYTATEDTLKIVVAQYAPIEASRTKTLSVIEEFLCTL